MSNTLLIVLKFALTDPFILPRLILLIVCLPVVLFGFPYVGVLWLTHQLSGYFWIDFLLTTALYLGCTIGSLYRYFTRGSVDPGKDGDPCLSPGDKRPGTKVLLDEPFYSRIPPPCVVNLYDVKDPSQMSTIIRFICKRAKEVLDVNPWLAGRMKTLKDQEKYDSECRSAFLWVPDQPPSIFNPADSGSGVLRCVDPLAQDLDPMLRVIPVNSREEVLSLDPSLDLKVKCAKLSCNKKDEPITKLTVVYYPGEKGTGAGASFALVLSIAHIVADAASIFNILNMFDFQTGKVRPLTYRRVKDWEGFPSSLHPEANRKIFWLMLCSNCGPVQRFLNGVQARIQKRCKAWREAKRTGKAPVDLEHRWLYYCYSIKRSWLEAEKKKYHEKIDKTEAEKQNAPFMSSNDVICSWVYRNLKPTMAAGFMLYNMRGRLAGVTEDLVGNYTSPLGLFRGEYENPANIRAAVRSKGKYNYADQEGPISTTHPGSGRSVCFMTNWAAFYRPLKPFPYEVDSKVHIATHLETHPYGKLSEDEEGQLPVPPPEATIWRRNDEGDLGIIIWHEMEPLDKKFDPENGGPTPFEAPYPFNVAGTSMLGLRKNEFK